MKLILILNRDAGTLRGLDPEQAAEELAAILRAHGHSVTTEVGDGEAALAAVERACGQKDFDAVVVGGGDGSVSAAAAAAAKCGATLGVVPLGTMNLFARSLGIPLEMKAAVEALATATRVGVDIAEVNGRFFVHHVTLGLHARMIKAREQLSYRSRLGKIRASFRAWWMVFREPPRLRARIRADKRKFKRRTAGILVSNNPLGDGHLPYADDPRQGMLGLYVIKSPRPSDLLKLAARVMLGDISANPHLDHWLAKEVDIALPSKTVSASVDGEIVTLAAPLQCRLHEGGLNVLKPRSAEEAVIAPEAPEGQGAEQPAAREELPVMEPRSRPRVAGTKQARGRVQ